MRGVSMDAIARSIKVSRPVVYSCFASREDLLNALLKRELNTLIQGAMAALPGKPIYKNLEQVMISGFQALLKVVETHQASWALIFQSEPDPIVAEAYAVNKRRITQRVAQLMEPGLQQAGVEDVPRKLPILVNLFMSICDAAVHSLIHDENDWSADELGHYFGRLTARTFESA